MRLNRTNLPAGFVRQPFPKQHSEYERGSANCAIPQTLCSVPIAKRLFWIVVKLHPRIWTASLSFLSTTKWVPSKKRGTHSHLHMVAFFVELVPFCCGLRESHEENHHFGEPPSIFLLLRQAGSSLKMRGLQYKERGFVGLAKAGFKASCLTTLNSPQNGGFPFGFPLGVPLKPQKRGTNVFSAFWRVPSLWLKGT